MHWGTIWGNAPFWHAGEAVLNEICPEGFKHYIQSVRVVEVLEKNGQGLKLDERSQRRYDESFYIQNA